MFGSGAGGKYPLLKAHEIIDPDITLDLKSMVKPNAILFMWCTLPLLYDTKRRTLEGIKPSKKFPKPHDALTVIQGWGFQYSTAKIWSKRYKNGNLFRGPGHYFASGPEILTVSVKGKFMTPKAWGGQCMLPGLDITPYEGHSVKPAIIHEQIDAMYPGAKKLELFARRPYPGWDVWGDEIEAEESCLEIDTLS